MTKDKCKMWPVKIDDPIVMEKSDIISIYLFVVTLKPTLFIRKFAPSYSFLVPLALLLSSPRLILFIPARLLLARTKENDHLRARTRTSVFSRLFREWAERIGARARERERERDALA